MAAEKEDDEEPTPIIDGLPLIEAATGLKNDANAHVKEQRFAEAVSLYEKAIAVLDKADGHPMMREEVEQMVVLKSVLYANVAQCMLNQKLFRRAVEAATSSLNLDEGNVKALHRRSQAHEALAKSTKALSDAGKVQLGHRHQWQKALDDALAVQKLGGGGLSPEALEARLKLFRDKLAEIQKLKEEESSEDEIGMDMVRMKERFDEVIEKYDMREDENFADEVAEWITSGEWVVTIKRVAQRWKMEEDDAEAFLKWIAKGVEFKAESSAASEYMKQQSPSLGSPSSVPAA